MRRAYFAKTIVFYMFRFGKNQKLPKKSISQERKNIYFLKNIKQPSLEKMTSLQKRKNVVIVALSLELQSIYLFS